MSVSKFELDVEQATWERVNINRPCCIVCWKTGVDVKFSCDICMIAQYCSESCQKKDKHVDNCVRWSSVTCAIRDQEIMKCTTPLNEMYTPVGEEVGLTVRKIVRLRAKC